MKILIDCSNLKVGGGIQVATSFINDLLFLQKDDIFVILLSPQMRNTFIKERFTRNFQFIDLPESIYKNKFSYRKRGAYIRNIEDKVSPSVSFCVFGPPTYKSKNKKVAGFAQAFFIYRRSMYIRKLTILKKIRLSLLRNIQIPLFKKNANAIIFEAEDSRQIFCETYNYPHEKTYTVNNTLNEIFLKPKEWGIIKVDKENKFGILCLAANYPHKNLPIIPKIIDVLIEKYRFTDFKFFISCAKHELNFANIYDPYISYLGKVQIENVPPLYQQMDVMLMPSLLETFSANYLEAMYMGVPIVATNLGFATSICEHAARYYSPLSAIDAADNIYRLLTDQKLSNLCKKLGKARVGDFDSSLNRTKKYLEILKGIACS